MRWPVSSGATRFVAAAVGARGAHRPAMEQLELVDGALLGFDPSHDVVDRDFACGNDVQQPPVNAGRRSSNSKSGCAFFRIHE